MQEMAFSKKVGKSRWEVLTGLVLTVLNLMQEKALARSVAQESAWFG